MDGDPELDVTVSNGRESATFQMAPVDGAGEAWAILEPFGPVTVVMGRAAAVEARSRLDRVIAARLAAGWVPVDVGSAGAPLGPATPLPADLVLHISHVLEARSRRKSGRARRDARRVDSTGVGDPVLEALQRRGRGVGCQFEGFKFSAPAKQQLMEGLAVAIQQQQIHFPAGVIVNELEAFGCAPSRWRGGR
jgi:hypothetical protein